MKFYICKHCGKVITVLNEVKVPTICCGEPMEELVGNTTDAALEKHVPVVEQKDNKVLVRVGEVEHPMTEEHYVQWIYVQSEHGGQRKSLNPGDKPEAVFVFKNDKPIKIFEYCNLHGLYSCDIE